MPRSCTLPPQMLAAPLLSSIHCLQAFSPTPGSHWTSILKRDGLPRPPQPWLHFSRPWPTHSSEASLHLPSPVPPTTVFPHTPPPRILSPPLPPCCPVQKPVPGSMSLPEAPEQTIPPRNSVVSGDGLTLSCCTSQTTPCQSPCSSAPSFEPVISAVPGLCLPPLCL